MLLGGWVFLEELYDAGGDIGYTDVGGAGGPDLLFYQVIAGNESGDAETLP